MTSSLSEEIGGSPNAPLDALAEIGKSLSCTRGQGSTLQRVLEVLRQRRGALRSAIALRDDATGKIQIEASDAMTTADEAARYRLGEALMRRVVESGKPIIAPEVSRERIVRNHSEMDRALDLQEVSYLCVPILVDAGPVGALGADFPFRRKRNYDADLRCLQVTAAMIGQSVKAGYVLDEDRQRLRDQNRCLIEALRERYAFPGIVGTSSAMRRVYAGLTEATRTDTPVLIRGECGTGKKTIARTIHYNSSHAEKAFLEVDCRRASEVVASELFGFGPSGDRGGRGRLELGEGGTLFLDAIGNIDSTTQSRLLRVLKDRAFERPGGTGPIRIDVRLIAATEDDLNKSVAAGTFREDLYIRLSAHSIEVPPLRQRKSDLTLLADHFLEEFSQAYKKPVIRVSREVMHRWTDYDWPGNLSEFESVVERAVRVCGNDGVIRSQHLPPTLRGVGASEELPQSSLSEAVESYERQILSDALTLTHGNRAEAARLLKTTARIFNYKVNKYDIEWKRFSD